MKTEMLPLWMNDAGCKSCDNPDIFFPRGNPEPRTEEAKRICRACPVWRECRAWGFSSGDKFATLGGMTSNQRARERTKRKKKAAVG